MSIFKNCVFITKNKEKEKPYTVTLRDDNSKFKLETAMSFSMEEEALEYAKKLSIEYNVKYNEAIFDMS